MHSLPAKIRPQEGELFLSWLARLAFANASSPTQFTQILLPHLNIWGSSINGKINNAALSTLVRSLDFDPITLEILTMRSFLHSHFIPHDQLFGKKILLPVGAVGHEFKRPWLQYCALCLKEDKSPYYRNIWRISYLPMCLAHNCLLRSECWYCHQPINFQKLRWPVEKLDHCWSCYKRLTNANVNFIQPDSSLAKLGSQLSQGFNENWVRLNRESYVMLPLFLAGLWLIIKLLLQKRNAGGVYHYFNLPPFLEIERNHKQEFSSMTPTKRAILLSIAGELLEDWPERFNDFCKAMQLNGTSLYRHATTSIPFWLHDFVSKNLRKQPYQVSNSEFEKAAIYILKAGYAVNYSNIAEAVGLNRSCHQTNKRNEIIRQLRAQQHENAIEVFHWQQKN